MGGHLEEPGVALPLDEVVGELRDHVGENGSRGIHEDVSAQVVLTVLVGDEQNLEVCLVARLLRVGSGEVLPAIVAAIAVVIGGEVRDGVAFV